MAGKRVEDNTTENIILDTEVQETKTEIPKNIKEEDDAAEAPSRPSHPMDDDAISCLRNEKVIVRFVPRPSMMVQNPKHVLYGGMAENAVRSFVVPKYSSTGMYVNVLTKNEKNYLEKAMGLEYNALSIYKKKDNFWDDSNNQGIGRVVLHKQDNYLDLSIPEDYIKYKILLANKDYIAPSLKELDERPKATYQFVIINEKAEAIQNLNRMDTIKRSYMEYGKIEDDFDTLRTVVELTEGRPISNKTKLDYLQGKINEYIQSNPRKFLNTIQDELLPAKVLIRKCIDAGLIGKRNDAYYLRADNTPLCEMNEVSTLNNAAKYISSVKRQELKFALEAKLKD